MRRAALTLALAAIIFVAGGLTGWSLSGDSDQGCEAVLELVELYEPSGFIRSDSYYGTQAFYVDPVPREIRNAAERYCD